MNIHVEFDGGNTIDRDVKFYSVNQQVRVLVLHNHNGISESYNMDKIKMFSIPSSTVDTEIPIT